MDFRFYAQDFPGSSVKITDIETPAILNLKTEAAVDPDEQTIKACLLAKGDPDHGNAWRTLFDRHFASVHNLAFKMTGDQNAADDLSQEVFLKVFRSLHKFKRHSMFSTWLYRIAMNTILTHLNSAKEKRLSAAEELPESAGSREASPVQIAIGCEITKEVEKQVRKMKPDLRAAIVLTSFQNLSPGEAAKVVGCSSDTFYWRLCQARKQLREGLSNWLDS